MDTYHQGGTTLAIMIVIMLGGLLLVSVVAALVCSGSSRRPTSAKVKYDLETVNQGVAFQNIICRIPQISEGFVNP